MKCVGLCAYDWQVSLGGETLPAEEFRALARLKVPLVRFRGEWVELKPGEVEAALRLFERGASGEMTAAEVLRLALTAPIEPIAWTEEDDLAAQPPAGVAPIGGERHH